MGLLLNMMQKDNTPTKTISKHAIPLALLLLASAVAIWSVVNVQDTYLTWVLEAAPAIVWMAALILSGHDDYRRLRNHRMAGFTLQSH
jgi:uncharacterized membrane protein YjdF